jgi:hypothetical protein
MKYDQLQPANRRPAKSRQLQIVRRAMNTSLMAQPNSAGTDAASAPIRTALPEASRPSDGVPIWLAALIATSCQAGRNGERRPVRWRWASGRALYTNSGRDEEHIEPLGVSLLGGHTMSVCWMPGETAYTVEVYRQTELCA